MRRRVALARVTAPSLNTQSHSFGQDLGRARLAFVAQAALSHHAAGNSLARLVHGLIFKMLRRSAPHSSRRPTATARPGPASALGSHSSRSIASRSGIRVHAAPLHQAARHRAWSWGTVRCSARRLGGSTARRSRIHRFASVARAHRSRSAACLRVKRNSNDQCTREREYQ
jgi:hypothetical protein